MKRVFIALFGGIGIGICIAIVNACSTPQPSQTIIYHEIQPVPYLQPHWEARHDFNC